MNVSPVSFPRCLDLEYQLRRLHYATASRSLNRRTISILDTMPATLAT